MSQHAPNVRRRVTQSERLRQQRMERFFSRFRRLQWRLTLSYMLVTVLVVLAIQFLVVSIAVAVALRPEQFDGTVTQGLRALAPEAVPYLQQTPVDTAGLDRWLRSVTAHEPNWSGTGGAQSPWILSAASQAVATDARGSVLATTDAHALPIGASLRSAVPTGAVSAVNAALAGETAADRVSVTLPNKHVVAVEPIFDTNGRVLGALYVDVDVQIMQHRVILIAFASLVPSAVVYLAFATVVGSLFGFLTARGLTRRLRTLTAAADGWSRGDFDVSVRDASGDELGQLAHDLNRMADHLRALVHDRQQLAVVEERNRLARDLHDSVKQQIFATAMQVATARALLASNPAAVKDHLVEAELLVGQAQQELTALIRELRPAAFGDKGLVTALREQCAEWSRRNGIPAQVRAVGEQATPVDVEQALYRVAQEALANIANHSSAAAVDVRLVWESGHDATYWLTMTIEDNGRGFDVAERTGKGLGLRSMRERVEALGGTLQIASVPSSGAGGGATRIEARVPVPLAPLPLAVTPDSRGTIPMEAMRAQEASHD